MITVKRGDTLAFLVRRKNEDDTPRTGEAEKLRSQMRTSKGALTATFAITETETLGDYLFQVPAADMSLVAPGTYECDIEFKDGELVQSSETFQITVEKDVTKDE